MDEPKPKNLESLIDELHQFFDELKERFSDSHIDLVTTHTILKQVVGEFFERLSSKQMRIAELEEQVQYIKGVELENKILKKYIERQNNVIKWHREKRSQYLLEKAMINDDQR